MSINQIILTGRLTADPEMKYTQTGTAITTFTLAVDRPKRKDHDKEADFIRILAFNKTAELIAQYLQKGRQAGVVGRLQIRNYEDQQTGQKKYVSEVIANEVQFLDSNSGGNGGGNGGNSGGNQSQSRANTQPRYNDDPFADDGHTIDISVDELPF
jgi:single-strand DNA-binding protein